MIEVARTELAAVTAALKFWRGWVESADRYTQKISAELAGISEGTDDVQKFAGRLTDFSREYFREMMSLPTVAVNHFASEVEKISKSGGKPVPGAPGRRGPRYRPMTWAWTHAFDRNIQSQRRSDNALDSRVWQPLTHQ